MAFSFLKKPKTTYASIQNNTFDLELAVVIWGRPAETTTHGKSSRTP